MAIPHTLGVNPLYSIYSSVPKVNLIGIYYFPRGRGGQKIAVNRIKTWHLPNFQVWGSHIHPRFPIQTRVGVREWSGPMPYCTIANITLIDIYCGSREMKNRKNAKKCSIYQDFKFGGLLHPSPSPTGAKFGMTECTIACQISLWSVTLWPHGVKNRK